MKAASRPLHSIVLPGVYRDSVFLMKLSGLAREQSGADRVTALMATPRNKEMLAQSGLMTPTIEAAGSDDLVVAMDAEPALLAIAEKTVLDLLATPTQAVDSPLERLAPKSLLMACERVDGASLALISVPGEYAKYEAAQALSAGLDVFLYSDGITAQEELALKRLAAGKGLLVMGPDCGAAVVHHTPIGFANRMRQGTVGIVSTTATALQEVGCLLDRCGLGISAAYGVGGRDLQDDIGGISTRTALERLAADANTRSIVVIGIRPGKKTRRAVAEWCQRLGKPVLVRYLGVEDYRIEDKAGIAHAATLREAVVKTAGTIASVLDLSDLDLPAWENGADGASPRPGWIRGLYSGGGLCCEAAEICRSLTPGPIYANIAAPGITATDGYAPVVGHVFLDLGADNVTMGGPHPLLFPERKLDRIVQELCSPEVAVILSDVILGCAVAPDYASQLIQAIDRAAALSRGQSRGKRLVVSVCGTEADQPSRSSQLDILRRAGVTVLGNNAEAARHAALLAQGGPGR